MAADDDSGWLAALQEQGEAGYQALLVSKHGSLALAAYELVTRRLRVRSVPLPPRGYELLVTAQEIADHVGWDGPDPHIADLVADCTAAELPIAE